MKKLAIVSATCLALAPLSAHAQAVTTFDGVLSFSTTTFSKNGERSRQTAFNMVSDIKFSEKFSLGFDADFGKLKASSSGSLNTTLTRLQLEPTLSFANGSYVGAFAQHAAASIYLFSVGIDTAGVFAGYDSGNWGVEGYLGSSTVDIAYAGLSATNYGLTAFYKPVPNLELFGHVAQADLSDNAGQITLLAFGAQYDFENGVMAYGATEKFDLGGLFGGSVSQYAFGVGYDLTKASEKLAGTITVEVAQNSFDSAGSENLFTVGWLIPLGKATATPLSSIARTARGGTRAPFVAGSGSSVLLSNFFPI